MRKTEGSELNHGKLQNLKDRGKIDSKGDEYIVVRQNRKPEGTEYSGGMNCYPCE